MIDLKAAAVTLLSLAIVESPAPEYSSFVSRLIRVLLTAMVPEAAHSEVAAAEALPSSKPGPLTGTVVS